MKLYWLGSKPRALHKFNNLEAGEVSSTTVGEVRTSNGPMDRRDRSFPQNAVNDRIFPPTFRCACHGPLGALLYLSCRLPVPEIL